MLSPRFNMFERHFLRLVKIAFDMTLQVSASRLHLKSYMKKIKKTKMVSLKSIMTLPE